MAKREVSRRTFLQASAASLAALQLREAAPAGEATQGARENTMQEPVFQRLSGEPYMLRGKRLVFTNWLFIRPGSFAWVDERGNNVTVGGSAGPWGPRLVKAEFPYGIRLIARKARRSGQLMDRPDSEHFSYLILGSIVQDGGIYRAWVGWHYRESADGMYWNPPVLCEKEGGGRMPLYGGTVFVDPSAPPGERYKWVGGGNLPREDFERFKAKHPGRWEPRSDRGDHILAVFGAVSGDGIRWRQLPEPLVVEHSDTHITAYYDETLRRYVIYTRNYLIREQARGATAGSAGWYEIGRRSIGRTESERFDAFPVSEPILVPHPELEASELLYTNCRTNIPGAPDLHLMFPNIWHLMDDTTSTAVASSHDGKVWNFLPGGYVLETPEYGEWDGGCHFTGPNLIELPNGDFALPYTGYNFPHKYPRGQLNNGIGYAIWPKGRIIALEAPERGEFSTVGFIPPGRKIRINAVTARAGHIRVEVVDLERGVIPGHSFEDCDPVIGDQFRKPLTWKGQDDTGLERGRAMRLRFRMERASIYGLDFE